MKKLFLLLLIIFWSQILLWCSEVKIKPENVKKAEDYPVIEKKAEVKWWVNLLDKHDNTFKEDEEIIVEDNSTKKGDDF